MKQILWRNVVNERNKRDTTIGSIADQNGIFINMTGSDVATYSSAMQRNVNPNSSTASIVRSIYPSNMAEKSLWVNTSELRPWYTGFQEEIGRFYGIVNPEGVEGGNLNLPDSEIDIPQYPFYTTYFNSPSVRSNPAFLVETATIPFKPTLLVGLMNEALEVTFPGVNNQEVTEQLIPRMKFNIEVDVVCSFRGLRKASIVA